MVSRPSRVKQATKNIVTLYITTIMAASNETMHITMRYLRLVCRTSRKRNNWRPFSWRSPSRRIQQTRCNLIMCWWLLIAIWRAVKQGKCPSSRSGCEKCFHATNPSFRRKVGTWLLLWQSHIVYIVICKIFSPPCSPLYEGERSYNDIGAMLMALEATFQTLRDRSSLAWIQNWFKINF